MRLRGDRLYLSPISLRAIGRLDEDIARLERFVERFRYKKSKAKQAQAKLTRHRPPRDGARPIGERAREPLVIVRARLDFLEPARSGRTVVEAEGRFGREKELLEGVSFAVEREEHVR